ncbi:MAG: hypothetical protein H0W27_07405, partial [Actinobacteria bacterium]|nr:hypothetical protein [Actinomycetota bacterium]
THPVQVVHVEADQHKQAAEEPNLDNVDGSGNDPDRVLGREAAVARFVNEFGAEVLP